MALPYQPFSSFSVKVQASGCILIINGLRLACTITVHARSRRAGVHVESEGAAHRGQPLVAALPQGHQAVTRLGGHRVNLVYRRFYALRPGLLLEEVRRRRSSFQVASPPMGSGAPDWHRQPCHPALRPRGALPASRRIGYIFGACDFVTPDTARDFLVRTGAIRADTRHPGRVHARELPVPLLSPQGHDKVGADQARERIPAPGARGLPDHRSRSRRKSPAISTGTSRWP